MLSMKPDAKENLADLLAMILENCQSLEELNFCYNHFSKESSEKIFVALSNSENVQTLKKAVCFQMANFESDETCAALADIVASAPNLTEFKIGNQASYN